MPVLRRSKTRIGAIAAVTFALFGIAMFSNLGGGTNFGADDAEAWTPICSICSPFGFYSHPSAAGSCTNEFGNEDQSSRTDPMGILFHGRSALAAQVEKHIRKHLDWNHGGWSDQRALVYHSDGTYHCDPDATAVSNASEAARTTRSHIRIWYIAGSPFHGWERQTVGTPHLDHWIPYEQNENCGNEFTNGTHAVPVSMEIPAKFGGPTTGSGFDYVKYQIAYRMGKVGAHHNLDYEKWGNTEPQHQCTGVESASNGQGVLIGVNHPSSATDSASSITTGSANLNGTISREESEAVEWWFGYGPAPSEEETYPNQTAAKTGSPAVGDINVTEGISGLAANVTYYGRIFVRFADGEVDSGNEISFTTCDQGSNLVKKDEDDLSSGPRPVAQCSSGKVDIFYRAPSGRLGHDWYVQGSGWAHEERPVSIAASGVPHIIAQANGTTDVFYRTPTNQLGHDWYVPGGGWSSTIENGPTLASDPHPINQANGTTDVFFRTPTNQLGHDWYVPGGGWSSTIENGPTLASDPHPINQANGTTDIFFRTPTNQLGHDWYVPGGGWSSTIENGPTLASDPHPINQANGTTDIFFRTPTNQLGHDWYVPGSGWGSTIENGPTLASDPHPVNQSNGTTDVFFRTPTNQLGHDWYVPYNGWSSTIEDGPELASDPHPVNQSNGTTDVFFRTPTNQLGHDWYVPYNGWSSTIEDGPELASDPHPVVQANGTADIFFRTPTGELGHDWYVPYNGWLQETRPGPLAARPPLATTGSASIDDNAATVEATVNPEGSPTSYYFEYGLTTSYGSKVPAAPQDVGSGVAELPVSQALGGLSASTTYHYRVVATSPEGTNTGVDRTFVTPATPSELAAMPVLEPFSGSAVSVANFNSNWGLLGWSAGKGEDAASGWHSTAGFPSLQGVFNNVSATDGKGVAAVATMATNPGAAERYFSLWLDMSSPGSSTRNGYELRFTYVSTNTYNVALSKWSGGSQTTLGSKSSYSFANGNSLAIVDRGSAVSAWSNAGTGFERIVGATDSAFSGGNAGLQAAGSTTRLTNFKAGTLTPDVTSEVGTTTAWRLRNANSFGGPDSSFAFGNSGVKVLSGDWNGDGTSTPASYDPSSGVWKLRNSNGPGPAEITFGYGGGIWSAAVAGDWNGDGVDTIGVYDPTGGNWNLRNSNTAGNPDYSFQYGGSQFKPLSGDWDGNGTDTIGLYEATAGNWNLRNSNTAGNPDYSFQYGGGIWKTGVVGDWDANGSTTIGVHDPSTGIWRLRNANSSGSPQVEFQYGGGNWSTVVGDWNGDGSDTAGVLSNSPPRYMLGTSNGAGTASWVSTLAEISLPTGMSGADFTGDGKADIVAAESEGNGKYRYMLGTSNGTGIASWSQLISGMSQPAGFSVADFTGDGKADIVAAESEGNGKYRYMLGTSNGTGIASWSQLISGMSQPAGFSVADFTGDGKADIVAAESEGNGKYRYMLGTSGGTNISKWNQLISGMSQPVGFSVADFTGDGKADIVAAESEGANGKYRYMLGTSNGTGISSWNQLLNGKSQPVGFSVADFTGDGKADIVAAESEGGNNKYRYMLGTSSGTGISKWSQLLGTMSQPVGFSVADFTGDGKADIVASEQ